MWVNLKDVISQFFNLLKHTSLLKAKSVAMYFGFHNICRNTMYDNNSRRAKKKESKAYYYFKVNYYGIDVYYMHPCIHD